MSLDDVLVSQIEDSAESCVVCGKSLAGASGHARLKHGASTAALGFPLCLETFQKSRQEWTRRGETNRAVRAIFNQLRPKLAATKPPAALMN